LFIKSKIQFFESKSQPVRSFSLINRCCLSSQRYNFLKANHNHTYRPNCDTHVVYQVKDTIFWKQITTEWYEFTSCICCLSSQRYNFLKANHNCTEEVCTESIVVYQVKDTIFWKQITTVVSSVKSLRGLFIKSKIQFFESKSQHIVI